MISQSLQERKLEAEKQALRAELEEMAELSQDSFMSFVRFMMNDYIVNWHHRVLADRLTRLIRYETNKRLMIFLPPRTGKSHLVSVGLPAWTLGIHPDHRVVGASYSAGLATELNGLSQQYMESDNYRLTFPGTRIPIIGQKNKSRAKRRQNLVEVIGRIGSYYSVGVGGSLTGKGANLLIIDDPYKDLQQAYSEARRKFISDWFKAVARTRMMPGGNIIVMHTRWHCLMPDTKISTTEGMKRIDQFKGNESVKTNRGWEKITKFGRKKVTKDIIKIKTYGNAYPIKVTSDHKILTKRGWLEAKDVNKTDLVVSAYGFDEKLLTDMEIKSLIPGIPETIKKNSRATPRGRRGITKERLEELIDEGLTYDEIADHYGLSSKSSIYRYVRDFGIKTQRYQAIKDGCELTNDFWFLIGLYIAEGSLGNGGKGRSNILVKWSLHERESHYIDLINKVFGVHVTDKRVDEAKGICLQISSYQLSKFIMDHIGLYSHKVRLSTDLKRLDRAKSLEMLRGWTEGDGSISADGYCRVSTASIHLAYDFKEILNRLGVSSTIVIGKKPGCNNLTVYELRFYTEDILEWSDKYSTSSVTKDNRKVFFDNDIMVHKIRDIEVVKGRIGYVYDISVPSRNFIAEGVTVHNCDDLAGELQELAATDPEATQWETLSFPMISTDIRHPLDQRTEAGLELWPDYFKGGQKFIAQLRKDVGETVWSALYQQSPTTEGGNQLTDSDFRYYGPDFNLPLGTIEYSWDLDFGSDKKGTSYVVGQVWLKGIDDNFYLLEQYRKRVKFKGQVQAIKNLLAQFGITHELNIENKANGPAVIDTLKGETGANVTALNPVGSKEARFVAVVPLFEAGRVFVPDPDWKPWVRDYKKELCNFPAAANDDQVDATSQQLAKWYDPFASIDSFGTTLDMTGSSRWM